MKEFLLAAFFSITLAGLNAGAQETRTQPGLILIGETRAKGFHVQNVPRENYTWFQAKVYCSEVDMRIASIQAEDYALLTQPGTAELLGHGAIYWTSGRDAQTWDQFVWDSPLDAAESVADGDQSDHEFFQSGYRTCVAFMIMKDGSSGRLAGLDCQSKYHAICQFDVD